MLNNKFQNIIETVLSMICSALLISCVLPGFSLIGNLFSQVAVTIVLNIIILLIFDFVLKVKPVIISNSLIIMCSFWIVFAVIKQIALHIDTKNHYFEWLYQFYYDKPALIFTVLLISAFYYIIKLFSKKFDIDYIKLYKPFMKKTVITICFYYSIILFYCFYLVREITWVRPEPNLIPFEMIRISLLYNDYELLFLMLGNIAIFFPLGILVSALSKHKWLVIIIPFLVSIGVEISQYFLGNGHPDVDDVILNIIGYYLGVLVRITIDRIVVKLSKGRVKSFFLF